MDRKTNKVVSKMILPDHVLLYISEEVKKPDVSTTFLKQFENYIDWSKVINNEIYNETTAFLPAFQYFINKSKFSKPWLNKQLRANTKKEKMFNCFDDILRFSMPESSGVELRNIRYTFPNQISWRYRSTLTSKDVKYTEIVAAVYLILRINTALKRNNELKISVPEQFKKFWSYISDNTNIDTKFMTHLPSLLKYKKDGYIGGIVILDVVERPRSPVSSNQDVVL